MWLTLLPGLCDPASGFLQDRSGARRPAQTHPQHAAVQKQPVLRST